MDQVREARGDKVPTPLPDWCCTASVPNDWTLLQRARQERAGVIWREARSNERVVWRNYPLAQTAMGYATKTRGVWVWCILSRNDVFGAKAKQHVACRMSQVQMFWKLVTAPVLMTEFGIMFSHHAHNHKSS
jgi:hypothetical protein